MKRETDRPSVPSAPTCWQREAPCPCLRIERSANEVHVFPYQHLVTASLSRSDDGEVLRFAFSSHDVEIAGHNLRPLLLAVQDFAVKWLRAIPDRYEALGNIEDGVITRIQIQEAK